jgi:tetratricopeptide (TPR) repeat protein
VAPQTPAALEAICQKALAVNASARYASAADLAREVERYLADEPVHAYREPFSARIVRSLRRRPAVVAGLAVALVLGLLAVLGGWWLAHGFNQQLAQTNEQLQRQNDDLRRAEQQIRARERNAQSAVRALLLEVGTSTELMRHDLEPVRRNLLEKAHKLLQQFVAEFANPNAVDDDQAEAAFALAGLSEELGQREAAVQHFTTARTAYAQLSQRFPEQPKYRWMLAKCHNNLAKLAAGRGDRAVAELEYVAARDLINELCKHFPQDDDYQQMRANNANNLGVLYTQGEQWARAERELRLAVQWYTARVNAAPNNWARVGDLARAQRNLGDWFRAQKRWAEAKAAYTAAVHGRALAWEADPHDHYRRADLARSWLVLGSCPGVSASDAQQALATAEALCADLIQQHSKITDFRQDAVNVQREWAWFHYRRADYSAALHALHQGRTLLEPWLRDQPTSVAALEAQAGIEAMQAECYFEQNDLARAANALTAAIRTRRQLLELAPQMPTHRRTLARLCYNLGHLHFQAERYADALPLLDEAHTRLATKPDPVLSPRIAELRTQTQTRLRERANTERLPAPRLAPE